jgi:oxygen-independent coproporphyrinogen-3 oxidase
MQQAQTLGLYLSVPFCRSKCTFCNFASGVYPAHELPRYLARLLDEIAGARDRAARNALALPALVDTVYFGGGTPSILSPAQLRAIFAAIREHFTLDPRAEITLEAAPAFLSDELLAAAVQAGVTRISFGVQTFVDAEARAVGRLHTAAQALDDLARARRAGLSTSVDLIAGLPGQTEASWRHSLAALAEAAPEHASIYMLEVDEDSHLGGEMLLGGTRYGAGLTPCDDAVADFYSEACRALAAQGLRQYEISNFARPGYASRHNERYWQRRPYLGVGLDAHSMLHSTSGEAVRFGTTDDLPVYLQAEKPSNPANLWADLHRLTPAEELEGAWFLGLRRNAGVSLPALRAEFGQQAIWQYEPVLASLAADGLLVRAASRVALTERGRMVSNDVFAGFLGIAQTCLEPAEIPSMAAATR